MTLYLVAVGRVRDTALRGACETYIRRIRRYMRLELKEVREAGRRERDAKAARRIEGDTLLAAIPAQVRIFTLTRRGKACTSEAFAELLERWRHQGRDVALVIGGAHGLDRRVLDQSEGEISLGQLTLPHELARLVLLEQVYRACTILRGEPYHKGSGP
ncbi:MAG: 23S rRNA (pseudouridine(1915)-N(3))-methyltransferase RlmH [Gemmatimonadales bacterium]|nr:23S rRNA (pseudouridine(1915)-N(3))-methyltransferase RlmH [Gemmatimonadales bacterium]